MTTNESDTVATRGKYALESAPESLTEAKRILEDHQQYADIVLAFTLKDAAEAGQDLELNAHPAFVQRPSSIAPLMPDEHKERLITHIIKQYS